MSVDRMVYVPRGESRPTRVPLDSMFAVKAGSEDTGGSYSLLEVTVGYDVPPHIHLKDDEVFYMLEGEMEATFEGRTYRVGPGDFMLLPRGVPHAIHVVSEIPPRLLQVSSPGGFEHFLEDLAEAPQETSTSFDPEALRELNEKHGMSFLPPHS